MRKNGVASVWRPFFCGLIGPDEALAPPASLAAPPLGASASPSPPILRGTGSASRRGGKSSGKAGADAAPPFSRPAPRGGAGSVAVGIGLAVSSAPKEVMAALRQIRRFAGA